MKSDCRIIEVNGLDTNEMMEILTPMAVDIYGDSDIKDLLKSYKQKDGENNVSDLFETIEKFRDLCKHITNFDDIIIKYITLLNTVVPKRWHDTFRIYVVSWMLSEIKWETDNEEEIKRCLIELEKVVEKNRNGFVCLLDKSEEQIKKNLKIDNSEKLNDMNKTYGEANSEWVEKAIEKIPVKLKNVKLYHGTSFDNYLKIKEDGYIKATDYSGGSYANDNLALAYINESGYVFTSDSFDFPLSLCFGGYRDNLISWAYPKPKKEKIKTKTNIGVVFEINSAGYEVFYYPGKGESEFLIKGNVDLKDTRVTFYDFNNGRIEQIAEEKASQLVKESK